MEGVRDSEAKEAVGRPMAKKKSRKSRRSRKTARSAQQQIQATQPAPVQVVEAAAKPVSKKAEGRKAAATDFVREYAYVYFDLRKMFTVAAIMFVLLIVVNMIMTHFVAL